MPVTTRERVTAPEELAREGFFVYPAINLAAFAGERRADGASMPNYGNMTVATDKEFTDMVALGRYIQENWRDPDKVRLINYDRNNEYRAQDVRKEIGSLVEALGQTTAEMERTVGTFVEQVRQGTLLQGGENIFAQRAREEAGQTTKPTPEVAPVERVEERAAAPPNVGQIGARAPQQQAVAPRTEEVEHADVRRGPAARAPETHEAEAPQERHDEYRISSVTHGGATLSFTGGYQETRLATMVSDENQARRDMYDLLSRHPEAPDASIVLSMDGRTYRGRDAAMRALEAYSY